MKKIIFIRHGQSEWNLANQFTGWVDVNITEKGEAEAKSAGQLIKEAGIKVDVAHVSVLKRAIRTLTIALNEMDRQWIPVNKSWLLNERHYGGLQGLNKEETKEKYGKEQVHKWRRGYAIQPPALDADSDMHPKLDERYKDIPVEKLPLTESLYDTLLRVIPYWEDTIVADLNAGKTPIVAAHGNSLRALIKHIDGISDEDIMELNIPTGTPIVYELDENNKPIRHYSLES